MQPIKTQKRQTQGPTRLYKMFLLTVPVDEVAYWQYRTVLIIFPLNHQTITITLYVVKRRGGDDDATAHLRYKMATTTT